MEIMACIFCGIEPSAARSAYCYKDAKLYGIKLAATNNPDEYLHHWIRASKVAWFDSHSIVQEIVKEARKK